MASTTTLLAWGLLSYGEAYRAAGQLQVADQALRWAADYFIKCHVAPDELYGQVGDFSLDHRYWGRPEELDMTRPAYKIDREHPGTAAGVTLGREVPLLYPRCSLSGGAGEERSGLWPRRLIIISIESILGDSSCCV